jgi:hypothetical protein
LFTELFLILKIFLFKEVFLHYYCIRIRTQIKIVRSNCPNIPIYALYSKDSMKVLFLLVLYLI